jgi:hypothetical protein
MFHPVFDRKSHDRSAAEKPEWTVSRPIVLAKMTAPQTGGVLWQLHEWLAHIPLSENCHEEPAPC